MCHSVIFLWLLLGLSFGPPSLQEPAKSSLVEQVSPGVRLLGRANPDAHLTGGQLSVSSDGRLLAYVAERQLLVVDRQRAEILHTIPFAVGQRLPVVQGLQFSPSGKVLAVLLGIYDQADLEFDLYDLPAETDEDWQIKQGKYLVVFENGRLSGKPFLVDESPAYLNPAPRIWFSPNDRWLIMQEQERMHLFDLQGPRALMCEKFVGSFFASDTDLVQWDARQSLDLQSGEISEWAPPESLAHLSFRSASDDGDFLVYAANGNGAVIYDRKTNTASPVQIDSLSGSYWGRVSRGGAYFAGFGRKAGSDTGWFFVYDLKQRKLVLEPTASIAGYHFLGDDAEILVQLSPEATWQRIPLSEDTQATLKSALDAYPISRKIQLADQDRQVVIGGRQRYVAVETGETQDRGSAAGDYYDVISRLDTRVFYSSAGGGDYSVFERDIKTGNSKKLYSHHSTSHLRHLLRNLLGGQPELTGVIGLQLKLDDSGKYLYEVRHDSHMGFIFRQWDLEQRRVGWEKTFRVRTPMVDVMRSVHISGDATRYAVTTNQHVWVIEAETGNVIREFDLPKIPIDLQLNQSGDLLAVQYRGLAQDIAKIVVLSIETGEELQTWTDGPLLTPVFSATGDRLAIMRPGKSNRLTVYNVKTWEPIWTHETSHAPATAIDISSDFRKLALALADTRIELWDLRELGMPAE